MSKRMLFVLAAVVLAVLGLFNASQNGKTARAKAATIVQNDQTGATDQLANADLENFVKSHVGATVTYTLTGSYNRAQAAAQAAAAAQTASNNVYAQAQQACSGKTDSITQARCNAQYLANHQPPSPAPSPVPTPKLADYKHTLRSPIWTADLAGAVFLGALLSLILGLFVFKGRRR